MENTSNGGFSGDRGRCNIQNSEHSGIDIPIGPGKTFNDIKTDWNHFIMREGVHDPAPAPTAGTKGAHPEKYWNEDNKRNIIINLNKPKSKRTL